MVVAGEGLPAICNIGGKLPPRITDRGGTVLPQPHCRGSASLAIAAFGPTRLLSSVFSVAIARYGAGLI